MSALPQLPQPPLTLRGQSGLRHTPPRLRWTMLIILLVFVGQLAYHLQTSHARAKAAAATQARNLAVVLEARLVHEFDAAVQVVRNMAEQVDRRQAVPAAALPVTARGGRVLEPEMLRAQLQLIGAGSALRYFDAAGDTVYSSVPGEPRINIADRGFFHQLRSSSGDAAAEIVYSDVLVGRVTQRPGLYVAHRLQDHQGRFAGAALAVLDLAALKQSLGTLDLGEHGIVTLHRRETGAVLLRLPVADARDGQPMPDMPVRRAVLAGNPDGVIEAVSPLDGQRRLLGYRTVGTHPFFLTVGLAQSEYLAAWADDAGSLLGVSALLLLVLLATFHHLRRTESRRNEVERRLRDSEHRFRALIERNRAVILLIDVHSGRIIDANHAASRYYGWSRTQLCGMNIDAINLPGAQDEAPERARALGELHNGFVFSHRLASGEVRRVEVHSTPVEIDGAPLLISIIHDITEREQVTAELERVLGEQAAIIGSPLFGLVKIRAGSITWVNPAFAAMFGHGADELLGQDTRLLFADADAHDEFSRQVTQAVQAGEVFMAESCLRRKDGSLGSYRIHCTALGGDSGLLVGACIDVTAQRELREQQQSLARQLGDLYNHAPCGYHSLDAEGRYLLVNQTELDWLGCERDELLGRRGWADFLTPEGREAFARLFPVLKAQGRITGVEVDLAPPGRPPRHISVSASAVYDQAGCFVMTRSVAYDITELHQAREALARLTAQQQAMLDNDVIGMVKLAGRRVVWKNRGMDRIFGYQDDEMLGLSVRAFFADDRSFRQLTGAEHAPGTAPGRFHTQVSMLRQDGSTIWVDVSGLALGGEDADTLWLLTDLTELRQYQEQIEYLAYHDGLTGLPNRLLLSDRLNQSVALARRHQRAIVVCYLDLDGFKAVNDAHGHAVGDLLLKTVARRLQAALRVNDTVCRVGGDEFVLVLTHLDQVLHYEAVLGRVGAGIAKPIELGQGLLGHVSASMGVALFPQDGEEPDRLLRCADQAMYRAKQRGRHQICRYDETAG